MIASIVVIEWVTYRRGVESVSAVRHVQLALVAMEKISAERGPANALLGEELHNAARVRESVALARLAGDQALDELIHTVSTCQGAKYDDIITKIKLARQSLVLARRDVDLLATRPKSQRQSVAINHAVEQMVAVIPILTESISALSHIAIQADPQLLDAMIGAELTANLREYAGQIGSKLTAPLIRQQQLSFDEVIAIAKLHGHIKQLRAVIDLRLRAYQNQHVLKTALEAVDTHYFGKGLPFLKGLLQIGLTSGHYGISSGQFATDYVPEMTPILHLRDVILTESMHTAELKRWDTRYLLIGIVMLGILASTAFFILLQVIRKRVLRPILESTDLFVALANDRLDTDIPISRHADEIGDMLRAIHVLKAHSADKIRLEKEREQLIEQLQALSNTDFLTGLMNRRAFFTHARQQFAVALRYRRDLSLILLDVDHFKRINDVYGHQAGDTVLCTLAQLCTQLHRKVDLLARYGGEEFLLLLPEADKVQGCAVAEKLRQAIEFHDFVLEDGDCLKVTASFGVASLNNETSIDNLIRAADCALYEAKNCGRNKVVHGAD